MIKKIFLSMQAMIFLLLAFAISSALATVVEAYYNTDAAWAYVYGTLWFGTIQVLLGINLAYGIYKYKIYGKKKFAVSLFHISFLFILIGSILTRYFGFEGTMHIREKSQSDTITSSKIYIQLLSKEKDKIISSYLSKYISTDSDNDFKLNLDIADNQAVLSYKDFMLNGALRWTKANKGIPIISIVFSDEKNRKEITLKDQESLEIGDLSFSFNKEPTKDKFIKISLKDGKFFINSNQKVEQINKKDFSKTKLQKNTENAIANSNLYTFDGINFTFSKLLIKAEQKVVPISGMGNNAIIANLAYKGEEKEVYMFFADEPKTVNLAGKEFQVVWSARYTKLPFSIYLEDFEISRYPGSNSPSSYSSKVKVLDSNITLPYHIYMNHVLDYQGYRFFQSSYDKDEKGTILSVNKDPGKFTTYFGYFLLIIGMFFNFFNPNSRFNKLSKMISKGGFKNYILVLLMSCFLTNLEANAEFKIPKEHSDKLASLIIQGYDGRMEPLDTLSKELLNKIYKKESYGKLDSSSVILSIMLNPEYWQNAEIIRISNDELKEILGLSKSQKYAKFGDFYTRGADGKTHYKLSSLIENANIKPASKRGKFDKEVIKADERLNIFYMIYVGDIFKIIPKENDPNNTWYSPFNAMKFFPKEEAEKVLVLLDDYFSSILRAQESGNFSKADIALQNIKQYQIKHAKNIIPSQNKLKFEILFNKLKIFKNLMPFYFIGGILLLFFVFLQILRPNFKLKLIFKSIYAFNILIFIIHTLGLGLRWYISNHAPWSNAYESLVYIAWALSLSGIFFSKKSAISLALTCILAGVTLFVAHLSAIDPQITTLQPVLDSYWLTIHVSVITASYGFLGLCSLLGAFTLILFLMQNDKNNLISQNIKEATHINEMSMILGLCLLTVGNFLGGIWANESWGRYWGWDSKETWALVTILIYAAVVHFRFIPKLNNQYSFAIASMFAYWSVIMTYFGVNFYLTGMHSYAAGESVAVPNSVWISALLMLVLAVFAFFKRKFALRL